MMLSKQRLTEPTQTAIDKRRRLDEERAHRIFDPKIRLIGVDKDALDAQIDEKNRLKQLETDRDEFFATQAVAMDKHALFLAAQGELEQRMVAQDIEGYRQRFQKKAAAREWDLNDPNGVINDIPARIGDSDPRCGAASMQVCFVVLSGVRPTLLLVESSHCVSYIRGFTAKIWRYGSERRSSKSRRSSGHSCSRMKRI